MVWFRIDDAFDDHPKALAAGNAALGLWTRCGAYSSRYLLDGFVPDGVARAKGTRAEIGRLIAAGLWHPVEGGYQMHDFHDWNPTSEQVKAERARNAERQHRHRQRHGNVSNAVTNTPSNDAPSRPVPSRPIDVPTQESSSSTDSAGRHDDDDRFSRAVELIVDAKVADKQPTKPKAYRMATRSNTVTEDGELIRRMLADNTPPEVVALFVLGHGNTAPKPTPRVPWCDTSCTTCDGTAFVDTGNGLAPCPDRKAQPA